MRRITNPTRDRSSNPGFIDASTILYHNDKEPTHPPVPSDMTNRYFFGWQHQPFKTLIALTGVVNICALLLAFPPNQLVKRLLDENRSNLAHLNVSDREVPAIQGAINSQIQAIDTRLAQLEESMVLDASYDIPAEFQGQTFTDIKLQSGEKVVALTLDDGPWQTTAQILDILKKYEVKATFFVVGRHMETHPNEIRRVIREGHAVGNHTWTHRYHQHSETAAAEELGKTADLLQQLTGVRTRIFRPPGGVLTNGLVSYAAKQNYATAMWSVDSRDYATAASSTIVDRVVSGVQSGSIVLLHDGGGDRTTTAKALPQIISQLRDKGYRFVTLPELMELKASEKKKEQLIEK
jgi:peptidoglycan-N-acetylglucosamine deacetylase